MKRIALGIQILALVMVIIPTWGLSTASALAQETGVRLILPEPGEDGSTPPLLADQASGAEKKIGDSLLPRLNSSDPVTVVITLRNQPMFAISQQVQSRYWDRLRANEEEIRQINSKYADDRRPANPEEAARMVREQSESVTERDRQRIRQINERSKALKDSMRREAMTLASQAVAPDHAVITQLIESLDGSVIYTFQIINSVAARVPGEAIQEIADHPLVARISEAETDQAHLNVSVPTTGATTFWNVGQNGGIWWNATCDTGVDVAHPALDDKIWWQGVFHDAGRLDPIYDDDFTTSDDLQGHGTHVAGIANSSDSTYRGVSYGSARSTNLKAGWLNTLGSGSMSRPDAMAAVHWGLNNATMDAINLSFGSYIEEDDHEYARFWDAVVDAQNTIATISAGNDGPGDKTLSRPGIFYNGLCVAWIDDMGTSSRADDIVATNSSRGPTWGERKKPDIGAPGDQIMAPSRSWETGADFVDKSGTSMAAPHVSGGAILLHDVGIYDPRTIKAILINTADFIQGSTSWNKDYGWGYMNLDTAYLRRTNYFLHSVTPQGTTGWYKLYKVPNPQIGDKTTMVWNRHVNYNNADYPVTWYSLNDLNLRYYRESTNLSIASSLSAIDNVEQVVSNTTDPLVIRAYAWSLAFYHPGATETYALAVPPGTVAATGPVLSANAASSSYTPPLNAKFPIRVRANNTSGDLAAHNCVLTVTLPAGVTLISGSLTNGLGSISAGGSSDYIELWLKATTAGTKTVNLSVTSNSYGVSDWWGSGSFTITPGAADMVAPYTVMPISGPRYQSSGTDTITNGGFESDLSSWTSSGAAVIETGSAHGGDKNLKLGPGTASAYQTVSISGSASRATLTFWYKVNASLAGAGCLIQNTSGDTLVAPYSTVIGKVSSWTRLTADVTRFVGQTVRINFYSSTSALGSSTFWVDDVTLKENESVWVDSSSPLSLAARDDNSGLDYSQYNIAGSGWTTYSAPFTLAGASQGYNSISYRSADNGANIEPTNSTAIFLDDEAPRSVLGIGSPKVVVGGTDKVVNGSFESGLTGWTASGSVEAITSPTHSGGWAAKIGGTGAGSIYQDVPVSAGADRAFASMWFRRTAGTGSSYPIVYVRDPVAGLFCFGMAYAGTSDTWTQMVWDVSRFKGASARLEFAVNVPSGDTPATMYVDDVSVWENADAYVGASSSLIIYSGERVGVEKYESDTDSAGFVEGQVLQLTGAGPHTILYRATDRLGHQESAVLTTVNTDDAGPTGSIVINGGAAYTASLSVTLALSATDPAGVAEMRIQSDSGVWGGWQAYQTSLNYTLSTAGSGTKTVGVQYKDSLGNISSTYTDTIEYLEPVSTDIPGAKMLPVNSAVSVNGKVVTATFPAKGWFYIEEPNRTSGIRVVSATMPSGIGVSVDVTGITKVSYAECEIALDALTEHGAAALPQPVGVRHQNLGGTAFHTQPAIPGAVGLNNVGLLVTTWGNVTKVYANNFYIDDGSNVMDSSPTVGVLVKISDVGLTPPEVGQTVSVTGISGASTLGGTPIRLLRPRFASDVKVLGFDAAFVFLSDKDAAYDYKNLLESEGIRTDVIPYEKIGTADWSKYHAVIVGSDTGEWSDPAKVTTIVNAGKPIIGIGQGGTRFLDAVTTPDLYIGWGNSATGDFADGIAFGGDIYTYPHDLGISPGSNMTLYARPTYTVALHDPDGVATRMVQLPDYPKYFPVANDAVRFYQWGYSGSPTYMSRTGKDLFVNLVFESAMP